MPLPMLEIWCSEGALVERRTEDNVSAVVEDGMSETLWVLRTKLLSAIEASHMFRANHFYLGELIN